MHIQSYIFITKLRAIITLYGGDQSLYRALVVPGIP